MSSGVLGREYKGGDVIVHQGEIGDCMYVIQEGEVEVVRVENGSIIRLAVLGRGDFFGEMAALTDAPRSAMATAVGDTNTPAS